MTNENNEQIENSGNIQEPVGENEAIIEQSLAKEDQKDEKKEQAKFGKRTKDQRRGIKSDTTSNPKAVSDTDISPVKTDAPEIIEKVVAINRITKVTKGGKKLSFSALVVVGDTHGNVGYSLSKAAEVSIAIRKAIATAKKNMVKIPMRGTTIPHEIIGQCSGSRVLLKPASDGTGVIASGPVRAVCDGAGIHNILTKCHRSNNPINVVKATMNGLMRLKTLKV